MMGQNPLVTWASSWRGEAGSPRLGGAGRPGEVR